MRIVQITILFGLNDGVLGFSSYTNINNARLWWRYSYHDRYDDPRRKNLDHTKTVLAASAVTDTVLGFVQSYQSSVENAGLLTDILTCSCINTMSDSTAQFLSFGKEEQDTIVEKDHQDDDEDNILIFPQSNTKKSNDTNDFASLAFTPPFAAGSIILSDVPHDIPRTARLSLFGLADGALSHIWFIALDSVVGEGQSLVETLIKTAADVLVYTPLWCAWFLAFMTCIEPISSSLEQREIFTNESDDSFKNRIQLIPSIWKSDWLELFQGNVGFFLPLTGLVYGFVPREERVLAFGIASFVYTTILSLWNKKR